jgi:GntR family transcriptional regulator
MKTTEFSLNIDKTSGIPVYVQFEEQIHLLIKRGVLTQGDALPTVRSLAVELGINANTVARAYRDLQNQGVLRLERGVGTFVADTAERPAEQKVFKILDRKVGEVIRAAKKANLTASEISRFIELRWKEDDHA